MIKKMAWNTFKNTGDINSYLELVELENIQKQLLVTEELKAKNSEENLELK